MRSALSRGRVVRKLRLAKAILGCGQVLTGLYLGKRESEQQRRSC